MKKANILVTPLRLFSQTCSAELPKWRLPRVLFGKYIYGRTGLKWRFGATSRAFLHPLRRLQANALLPRLHLSDSFGMFSSLHLFFRSGRILAERPVCGSTRAVREFSLSGRINDGKAGSVRDSGDLVGSSHFSFDEQILLVSLDSSG